MSTPSPVPLDNFDPVSPYAPKWAHAQNAEAPLPAAEVEAPPRPAGIETDHDARILDEIEASLRAMIAANHPEEADDASHLSDVSRIAAEHIAQQEEMAIEAEPPIAERPDVEEHAIDDRQMREDRRADTTAIQSAFRDPRTPPWLSPRSLEPEPIPEPISEHWPRKRKRSKSNSLFLRFGLAATGAAVVAAVVIKDVPSYVMEKVRGPITDLSTNAAAVFNEGKASPLQVRLDAVQKEQERAPAPALQYAVANADTAAPQQYRPVAVKTETVRSEARKETVMSPWPSPEQARRPEPWPQPSQPARAPEQAQAPAAASTAPAPMQRTPTAEEIAMLRKMGDDYIASGDFVGARAVLERAADAGDASAAFAIASTYDPVVLARFKVRGLEPDLVKAGFWYERARELGSTEAPRRLQAMMAARGN